MTSSLTPILTPTLAALTRQADLKTQLVFDPRLSKREQETLCLVAAGFTASESAALLSLHPETITQYRQTIKKKLGCKNLAQAVLVGIKFSYLPR